MSVSGHLFSAVTKVYNDMLLAADGGQVTILCLSTGLDSGFRHCRPRLATVPSPVSVWNSWRRSPVVPFISAGQIVPCYLRRFHVDDDSHCVLGTTRFGLWSASVHFVQGGPIAEVVKKHNMNIHVFADDTRSCISAVIATRWQQLLNNCNDVW